MFSGAGPDSDPRSSESWRARRNFVFFCQVSNAQFHENTLNTLHPNDKQITDCIYKIPCASCEKCYVWETGRKFGTRLKEHETEVESITSKLFIWNQRASSLSRTNQHWLTIRLMITMWSISRPLRFWTKNRTKVLDGSKRQYINSVIRTTILEPGRGQLHAEPYVRPISCHVTSIS